MTFNLDHSIHIGELVAILGIGWRLISALNRLISMLEDFPPHRHVNGKVIYPKGYSPEKIEALTSDGAARV